MILRKIRCKNVPNSFSIIWRSVICSLLISQYSTDICLWKASLQIITFNKRYYPQYISINKMYTNLYTVYFTVLYTENDILLQIVKRNLLLSLNDIRLRSAQTSGKWESCLCLYNTLHIYQRRLYNDNIALKIYNFRHEIHDVKLIFFKTSLNMVQREKSALV